MSSIFPGISAGIQFGRQRSAQQIQQKTQLLPLSFHGDEWTQGPIFDWYHSLEQTSADAVAIHKLEIRKDTSGPVPHRFVMLYMRDNSVHRLDRRPNAKVDGVTPLGLARNMPVTTKDEILCHLDKDIVDEINKKTHHEIDLSLDGQVDLKIVLVTSFVISRDAETKHYTLFTHNCFFFSWTILMVASRRYLPYAVSLEGQTLEQRIKDSVPDLTTFVVEEFTNTLVDAVIDTMLVFRKTAGPEIQRGEHILIRTLRFMPSDIIRLVAKQALKRRLRSGLRERLEKQVSGLLERTTVRLCQNALINHNTPHLVERYLWLNQLPEIILSAVRTEMIFMEQGGTIFDAITGGVLEAPDLPEGGRDAEDLTFKHARVASRLQQFHAVWNAVLHGALKGAKNVMHNDDWANWQKQYWEEHIRKITEQPDVSLEQIAKELANYGHGILDESNRRVVDFTWDAARDGALAAAKAVVKATEDQVKHRRTRDPMWRAIWEAWNPLWDRMRPQVGEKLKLCISRIVLKMVDVRMNIVISELGDSNVHFVMARFSDVSNENELDETDRANEGLAEKEVSERKMNNESLQMLMRKFMKKDTLDRDKYDKVVRSMARLWREINLV